MSLCRNKHNQSGSILPFVAIGLPLMVGLLAFAVDLTRNIGCVRQLEFAADSAAVYAASYMTNNDGSYDAQQARNNMVNAIASVNGGAWNYAPAGAVQSNGQNERTPVTFDDGDLSVVANPNDTGENFVRLTAHRTGGESLVRFFAPVFGAAATVSPTRTVEVVAQPASRVGAAAPYDVGVATASFAPFAVFPLGISNAQFAAASSPAATNTIYTADVVTASGASQTPTANHLKACFVNVAPAQSTGQLYGDGQGNNAIDQLVGLITYFSGQPSTSTVMPSAVERGVDVQSFNPQDATFASRKTEIVTALSKVANGQWLILPVLEKDPSVGSSNRVVGFARMQLAAPVNTTATSSASMFIQLRIGESVPLRNVAAGNFVTLPQFTGAVLPAPTAPFAPRDYDFSSNSLSPRPRGVVMAATLSPRTVTQ